MSFCSSKVFFKIIIIIYHSKLNVLARSSECALHFSKKCGWQNPQVTKQQTDFPKIHTMTMILWWRHVKCRGEETYHLQPGVRDQHLILFILEESRGERAQGSGWWGCRDIQLYTFFFISHLITLKAQKFERLCYLFVQTLVMYTHFHWGSLMRKVFLVFFNWKRYFIADKVMVKPLERRSKTKN